MSYAEFREKHGVDPIGCGANRGGCGCLGLWDCVNDDKLQRVTDAVARLKYDHGCVSAQSRGEVPCGRICECRDDAVEILRTVFTEPERA